VQAIVNTYKMNSSLDEKHLSIFQPVEEAENDTSID
jgi:hypothetical protein